MSQLNERLKVAQTELTIRDERIQSLIKQVELKASENAILQKVNFFIIQLFDFFFSFLS